MKPLPPNFPEKPYFSLSHLPVTIYIPPECYELWISRTLQENTGRVAAWQDGSRNYFRHNKGIWKQDTFILWNRWLLCLHRTCLAILEADTDHRGGSSSKRWKVLKWYWVINIFENRSLRLGRKRLQNQGGTHGNSTRDIWRENRFLAGEGKNSPRDRQILSKHKLVVIAPNAKIFRVHGRTKNLSHSRGVCPMQALLQRTPGLWAEQSTAQNTAETRVGKQSCPHWERRDQITGSCDSRSRPIKKQSCQLHLESPRAPRPSHRLPMWINALRPRTWE